MILREAGAGRKQKVENKFIDRIERKSELVIMSLARVCLLLISGPGCLVQSIILNQIKIPLHPQVIFYKVSFLRVISTFFFQKWNVES